MLSLVVTAALTFSASPAARPTVPKMSRPAAVAPKMITGLEGPALVSAAHVILAYNFMPLGPTAYGLGMGGKQMSPGQKKWGERAFGNMIEQAPMFQTALWLHANFVSPVVATQLGITYLCLRLMYPVIWAVFGGEDGVPHVEYSTVPLFGVLQPTPNAPLAMGRLPAPAHGRG